MKEVDREEVKRLLIDSYQLMAPRRLAALVYGVGAVAGEDGGFIGQRVEALRDGSNALLEVGGRLGADRAAVEEHVAGE